jgi:hypothetical protein
MMFYTIDEDKNTVSVIRFLYGHRNWKRILERNVTIQSTLANKCQVGVARKK